MKANGCMSSFFYVVFLLFSISAALTPQNPELLHLAQQRQLPQNLLSNAIDSKNETDSLSHPRHAGNIQSPERNPFAKRQVAAGGGIAATTLPPTPYPTVTYAASLYTLGTYTSTTWKEFTQTFATTALGTWALGPTPGIGTIGLGTIIGTVGAVKKDHKRALQTPIPQIQSYVDA